MTQEASLGFKVLNRMDSVVTWAIFSVFFYYLRSSKGVGHQQSLLNLTVFFGLRTVLAVITLVAMAFTVNTWAQNLVIGVIVAYSVWMLLYLVAIREDVKQTFADSEWMNKLRRNKLDDKEQARIFLRSQAAEGRQRAEALFHAVDASLAR